MPTIPVKWTYKKGSNHVSVFFPVAKRLKWILVDEAFGPRTKPSGWESSEGRAVIDVYTSTDKTAVRMSRITGQVLRYKR